MMKWQVWAVAAAMLVARIVAAADNVIITEFMAKNQNGLVDEDGSNEDWIEIYNAGTNTVNLLNWSLTDSAANLTKWRFPSTNIAPGRFMIVWASNKNRRTAGAPLHTNFKLDPDPGEYLALVRPDNSIATQFAPTYPPQAQDISYGFPVTGFTNSLVPARTNLKYLVPTDFSQDLFWTDPGYNDAAWASGLSGLGYNFPTNLVGTDVRAAMSNVNASVYLRIPFTVDDPGSVSTLYLKMRYNDGFVAYLNGHEIGRKNAPSAAAGTEVANSTNDWSVTGAQNINGWSYGYYNRGADTNDNTYTYTADFNAVDEAWLFTGTNWILGVDDPPFTMIGTTNWMPNGTNNFANHWPVRRWVSPVSGVVTAQVFFAKLATTGSGATLRVFHNGNLLTARTLAATDTTGFTTNLVVTGLDQGDMLDFALDPTGTDNIPSDTGDLCAFRVSIQQAPNSDPGFNSLATGAATAAQSSTGETFDITPLSSFLVAGTNVLAVQGMNISAADPDFLVGPELLAVSAAVNTNQSVYFVQPTPGAVNGLGTTNLGPLILDVAHTPLEPLSNQVVTVTARVSPTFRPVSSLTLRYRVMFNAEVSIPMYDDGQHNDGATNDGVFAAAIPANIAKAGEMVRYYIISADNAGVTNRSPSFLSLIDSPQYWGLVVKDLSITSSIPVLSWYVTNTAAAATEAGTRCSIYYDKQFRDNVGVTLHGQSSAGFPKHSFNFNLNSGYKITINKDYPDLSDFALISTWADRTHFRVPLNTENYATSGVPAHYAFPLRVQQNGTFYCLTVLSEQGNEKFLERIGYDPDGALYKMYNTFTGAAGNEKKTRKYEPSFDLQALYNAITQPDTAARAAYIFDNVNLPEVVNFLATKTTSSDHDCCHKNYYFYRDSNGSGEWFAFPWDFDLSFGHVWTSTNGNYFDDTMYTNVPPNVGANNTLFALMNSDPVLKSMWMRRTRTLADTVLQPPGIAATNDMLRQRIDYYAELVRADAALDKAKWGSATWVAAYNSPGNPSSIFDTELSRMKDYYLPGRRTFINLSSVASTYSLPSSQPTNFFLTFGVVEYNPASSNQAQEYLEIKNTNTFAVDISGWKLTGGVDFTFANGTIITATNRLYVSPDVKSFRARTISPKAGQRVMVVGPFKGQLSARGETLTLLNAAGTTNATLTYTGAPSLAQQFLRVTEIMYHPSGSDDYEYIELKNISPSQSLDLNGVKLVDGITFDFAGSSITNLSPGQRCLVVRSNAAFVARYGAGYPIAGSFIGALDNGGERIRLLDKFNEEILDFSYNNSWYPITDGLGFSLVVVDENAVPEAWSSKTNWRPSSVDLGSPASGDSAPATVAPVLVNEVLTHTLLPDVDAVELYNPNTNDVDISGWFLTDNLYIAKKYRIPDGTTIQAGGYIVFDETQFNVGPTAFAFSSSGEEVYLFSGNATTNLTGYYDGFSFGAADPGVSFGRYVNSVGTTQIVAQATNSFGQANVGPKIGQVVVSEIMYHPPASAPEYIELLNVTTNPVPLFEAAYPTNTWILKDAVSFAFPTNTVIAPSSYVLVVPFNPSTNAAALAAFRSAYSVPSNAVLFGPFTGALDNASDNVELAHPRTDTNGVNYVLVDKVDYQSAAPWAGAADGFGPALHRIVSGDYGNDPTNWIAAIPSPGQPRADGVSPSITQQPLGTNAVEHSSVTLSVAATGTAPFGYQWSFNGAQIPGATAPTYTIVNAQLTNSGNYAVAVFNGAGAALSSNAYVNIRPLPRIVVQPVAQTNFPGSNLTAFVTVSGSGVINYQWRRNSNSIPGAVNSNLIVTNIELYRDAGYYDVTVTDDVGTVTSTQVVLNVWSRPVITNTHMSVTVLQGQPATFAVVAGPIHPLIPIAYRWSTTSGTPPNNTNSSLVLTNWPSTQVRLNVQTPGTPSNFQTNVTTNIFGVITLTVLADFDRDGMADVWEAANGLNTNNAADALFDNDGDGMINRDEFLAGTDPNNALSVLKLTSSATNSSQFQFTAQSNITYVIQSRSNFSGAAWQPWSNLAPQNVIRTIPIPLSTNVGLFYRVVVPPSP